MQSNKRPSKSMIVLVLVCLAGPIVALSKGVLKGEGDFFTPVRARTTASLCLITVDGISPRDLPLYNSELPNDPFLTEFARLGVTVNYAFGATNTTPAAAASIVTGQLPSTHGVMNFQNYLNAEFVTLGEMFQRREMKTAAFSNLPLLTQCGLGVGFDTKEETIGADARTLGAQASEWIANLDQDYFFCWVHYSLRTEDKEDRAKAFRELLESVVDGMKKGRKYEGTYVIATGTYGRTAGDLSVPMLWKIPMRTAIGSTRNGPCSTLDIMATLMAIFDMRNTLSVPGRNLVADPDQPLYSGHYFTDPVGAMFEVFLPKSRDPILGIRNHRWGVTQGPKPANVAAYKVEEDPAMTTNQVGTPDGDRAKAYMLEKLFERKRNIPVTTLPPERLNLPPHLREQLRDLHLIE